MFLQKFTFTETFILIILVVSQTVFIVVSIEDLVQRIILFKLTAQAFFCFVFIREFKHATFLRNGCQPKDIVKYLSTSRDD